SLISFRKEKGARPEWHLGAAGRRPRTPAEPLPPDPRHHGPQVRQGSTVPGDPVVTVLTTKFLTPSRVLLRDRQGSVPPTPGGDLPDRPVETTRGRRAPDHRLPFPRPPPRVGEAQKVERPGSVRRSRAIAA